MTASQSSRTTAPNVLFLRCDECDKCVRRDGYIKIDREAVARNSVTVDDWEVIDPSIPRIYWKILHEKCDPDPTQTDFRLSARKLSTESDLLLCTAWLLRNQPELVAASNWHGLIGRILADTEEHTDWLASPEHAEYIEAKRRQREARRQKRENQMLTDPNDPRHGTDNGYCNYGCRCDRCTAAHTERVQANRASRNGHDGAELVCAERA